MGIGNLYKVRIMKTTKKEYTQPIIDVIVLDYEIALVLESSTPPIGPSETKNATPEFFKNNPFNTGLA